MSDSPFADFANAVLVFQVATEQIHEDPDTGNPISIAGSVEVKAKLDPSSTPRIIDFAGPDQNKTPMKGRAVDPQYLPPQIKIGSRSKCTLFDPFTGNQQTGIFEITVISQSGFAAVTEVLGSYIEGNFKADVVGDISYA